MAEEDILHQEDVEGVIDEKVEEVLEEKLAGTSDHAAIADLAAPSAAYVEAEQVAQTNKINEILDVLRDAGLIPAS